MKSLGVIDVLIAVRAREAGAILVTTDWALARFYMSIASGRVATANRGQPVIYVPARLLG